jgi:uncharacterized protein YerC
MRLSDQVMSEPIENEIRQLLSQIIADIRSENEAQVLISNLLTETEQLAVAKRLAIALFLKRGQSYENIKQSLKVSSATVAKVQESLDTPGVRLALRKVETDEWAEEWAGKLSKAFSKLLGK